MIQENLLIIAILVFALMLVGLLLTIREFKHGSPKLQEEGKEELRESPHNDV
jgi:hypothetical protein